MTTLDVPDKDDIREIVREEVADFRKEQQRQGGLLENLNNKFSHVTELLSDNLKVEKQVRSYEGRVKKLEGDNEMVKSTVKLHSKQLKALN